MSKPVVPPGVLAEGSFGAFVLDQLGALGGVEARPMFGGAGLYLDCEFFGILYKKRLYFRVSADTIADYTIRKMKPFQPFEGRQGRSRRYYEVPIEVVESADDLVSWAKAAQRTPPPAKKTKRRAPKAPKLR